MYNVVDDLINYYDSKKADYEKFCQENTKPFEIPPVSSTQLEDDYRKRINSMANQIASYKLNIQNDTEVIYKLMVHRNILEVAIKQFLEKIDEQTKQLLISTINEVKDKRENKDYKDYWWNAVNQEDFSAKLLWEIKNPEKISNPYLNFPNINMKLSSTSRR